LVEDLSTPLVDVLIDLHFFEESFRDTLGVGFVVEDLSPHFGVEASLKSVEVARPLFFLELPG
jgi:hypothetical protein